jgi:allophanate hydrolase subunit 2
VGISRCGALDKPALTIANLLVGNAPEAAALEITLGQVDVQFTRHCWFALTGAACEATLDGAPVWLGWRMAAKAGQHLVLKNPQHGIRSYLAVAGGIDVPKFWFALYRSESRYWRNRRAPVAGWRSS